MAIYEYPLLNNSQIIIDNVKQKITAKGDYFEGDLKSGNLKIKTLLGNVEASYEIHNQIIQINVYNKPWTISDNRIKVELDDFFIAK